MINPPLNALRTFESAARLNNFSEAAEELCVTQSAVSHQIKRLESWLGVRLFSRQGNVLQLLPKGQDLAKSLTLSLGNIEQICTEMRTEIQPMPIVVAAIPSIATMWLVPRLDSFRQAHPDIDIQVEYALHGESIDYNNIDFAFTFSDALPIESNAQSDLYLSGTSFAVCSSSVAEMPNVRALDPKTMQAVGLLVDTDTLAWKEWFKKANLSEPELEKGLTFRDFNLLRAATLAGQGIALCPKAIIQKDLNTRRLVQLSEIPVQENFNYYMTRSSIRRPSHDKATNAFERWVLSLKDTANEQ